VTHDATLDPMRMPRIGQTWEHEDEPSRTVTDLDYVDQTELVAVTYQSMVDTGVVITRIVDIEEWMWWAEDAELKP